MGDDRRNKDSIRWSPAARLHGAKNLLQETKMSTAEVTFDYEKLPRCQYPVLCKGPGPRQACDCDETAVAFGWWSTESKEKTVGGWQREDGWRLCQKHLDIILEKEKRP